MGGAPRLLQSQLQQQCRHERFGPSAALFEELEAEASAEQSPLARKAPGQNQPAPTSAILFRGAYPQGGGVRSLQERLADPANMGQAFDCCVQETIGPTSEQLLEAITEPANEEGSGLP